MTDERERFYREVLTFYANGGEDTGTRAREVLAVTDDAPSAEPRARNMYTRNVEALIERFRKRRDINVARPRVDNAKLPAGAPMTYYCTACAAKTCVMCEPCRVLYIAGIIARDGAILE